MNQHANETLRLLSTVWVWDGDWMKCRKCKKALVASRDGEELVHARGCRNSGHVHPWADLRRAIQN